MATRTLNITGGIASTAIVTELGLLSRLGEALGAPLRASQVVWVTDETVGKLYGQAAMGLLSGAGAPVTMFTIAPGEVSKSIAAAERLYGHLAQNNFGRDGLILALGGGVVSDLAGFVAATWMRGVQWAICPTTLEAMIDAAIGGKTAVNIPGGKNLIGAFHHPRVVLIDPDCLATLPDRDLRAGLAESVKHAAVFSAEFFDWHEQHADAILRHDPYILTELIERNVAIKTEVVEKDAVEQAGHRMLLNFGHTIGHAIEECSGFALRHGECVALGMVAASRLSQSLGLLEASVVQRLVTLLDRLQLPTRLSTGAAASEAYEGAGSAGVYPPTKASASDWPSILEAMRRDKKVREGRMHFVLLKDIGMPVIRNDVEELQVREAFDALLHA